MKTREYTLRFDTPAFLGNAEQSGQWRTPPIKAQLRQWWRVAYAADHGFSVNVAAMRREEGLLFGNAWIEDAFCKSLVRIRLGRWDEGRLRKADWPRPDLNVKHPEEKVEHPEVGLIGSWLYLGYGPLVSKKSTALKANAAIQAGEEAHLSLAWPMQFPDGLRRALRSTDAPDIWPEKIDERMRY
ncbi:MAG: hypothetical protein ACK4TK_01215, partial [Thiobacillaceae bacterium]